MVADRLVASGGARGELAEDIRAEGEKWARIIAPPGPLWISFGKPLLLEPKRRGLKHLARRARVPLDRVARAALVEHQVVGVPRRLLVPLEAIVTSRRH